MRKLKRLGSAYHVPAQHSVSSGTDINVEATVADA